jgi:hypothetical protein
LGVSAKRREPGGKRQKGGAACDHGAAFGPPFTALQMHAAAGGEPPIF